MSEFEPPPIPVAALEHYMYCPRQCALIHVDGRWNDNEHTVRGNAGHRRADSPGSSVQRGVKTLRAVPIWSTVWSLTGRADAVEVLPDGQIRPVEYKIGTRHGRAADVQLCAQAFCLEEMTGLELDHGLLWLARHRRRQRVDFDKDLRDLTAETIERVGDLMAQTALPVIDMSPRCEHCQFLGHCLPDLVSHPERVEMYVQELYR